jgi:hypothetical protein
MGLFKKSKERQLKQDIRRGLRKNESVSVSDQGLVTGLGGDKVKLSGRGRRKLAKDQAAQITSGNAGGKNTVITAEKNAKRVISPKSVVGSSSSTSTRTNKKGTVISKTTNTKDKDKVIDKQRARGNVSYNDGPKKTTTTFTPGSISKSGMGTANEFSFRGPKSFSNPSGVQSTNMGGMMADMSASRAKMNQTVDNFGRGGIYSESDKKAGFQFQMRGNSAFKQLTGKGDPNQVLSMKSPLNDDTGEEHKHTNTSTSTQKVDVGGGVTRTDNLSDTETTVKKPVVKDPNQATGAKLDYYKKEKSRCEKNPNADGCSGFKPKNTTSSTSSVESQSIYPISTFTPGTEKSVTTGGATGGYSLKSDPKVKSSSSSSSNTDRTRVDRKKIRQDNRIERKANRKQDKLDKQGGGTNCRMVCD